MYKWLGVVLVLFSLSVKGQELNCTVKVSFERITDANPQVFKTLERSLNDFVNNTRWTSRDFDRSERIECSMFINVSAYDNSAFTATLQVQSSRPVFNSSYSSPILNFNDKDLTFRYNEGENLYYNPNSFDSNLVGVIAFYANMIIGFDADSFEKSSGTPYYQVAQNIAGLGASSGGYKGWSQQDGNLTNRYFLVTDILSNTFTPFRESLYEYHLGALDIMSEDQKAGKEKIIASLKTLAKVQSVRPNAFLTRVFFDAKSDEIVAMFSGGPVVNTTDLVEMLNRISPLNGAKWNKIK